jgi:hypothetical protein
VLRNGLQRGWPLSFDEPDWRPLIDLAPEHAADFMWVYAARLESGALIQGYKHRGTRCHLFLDAAGRAFACHALHLYRSVDRLALLVDVLTGVELYLEPRYIVRHNALADYRDVKWTRAATRHRISRERVRDALAGRCIYLVEPPRREELRHRGPRRVFLGEHGDGVRLEVMAVLLEGGALLVIHAMPMRERYRREYEEAGEWPG